MMLDEWSDVICEFLLAFVFSRSRGFRTSPLQACEWRDGGAWHMMAHVEAFFFSGNGAEPS